MCICHLLFHIAQIMELERRAAAQGDATRDSGVGWAEQTLSPEETYFIDTRGDKNNLVYDALYRGDVAAYHRIDPAGFAKGASQHHGRQFARCPFLAMFSEMCKYSSTC